MTDKLDEFERLLKDSATPEPDAAARKKAVLSAMDAFDQKNERRSQGIALRQRLMEAVRNFHNHVRGENFMKKASILASVSVVALALLVTEHSTTGILPVASKKAETMRKETVAAASKQGTDELTIQPGALPAAAVDRNMATDAPVSSANSAPWEKAKDSIQESISGQPVARVQELNARQMFSNENATLSSPVPAMPMANNKTMATRALNTYINADSAAVMPPSTYTYNEENRDKFEHFTPNATKAVTQEPVSTFSIDVDTSSYSFLRASLNRGIIPQPDAVRTEELINYFPYNYAIPKNKEVPFMATVSVFPTPWNPETKLMHIGIKGYEIEQQEKPHSNLVFLLDTSGSMNDPVRLPLIVSSMKLLLDSLKPDDTVAIVTYAGASGVALEPTPVSERGKITEVLDRLQAYGSTAGFDGLQTAYRLAEQHYDPKSVNRVILSTDGDFNVGITDQSELKQFIAHERDKGIFLSVLGVGMGNYNDAVMQTLAQNGNGVAAYIDNLNEARKVLVEEAGSTLFTIAKDVKIQVEFNPAQVAEYRLVGYESRLQNREDFNNDKVDAGDIGSGHAVTALYEITPVGSKSRRVDDLRYQKSTPQVMVEDKISSNEYAFVKIRYKLPNENVSKLISQPVDTRNAVSQISEAPEDARFATAVAGFAQLLKGDPALGNYTYDDDITLARAARGTDTFGYRAEFINLVELAKHLAPAAPRLPQNEE